MLTSGVLGTMGYGFSAAISAHLAFPKKDVISISGDGEIQMNIQELATAVSEELPIIICIFNNEYLGNIRQWQEMFYEKRFSYSCLKYKKTCNHNCKDETKCCLEYVPNFIELAHSYGAKGLRVTRENEVKDALTKAKKRKKYQP